MTETIRSSHTPDLETDRLVLRPFVIDDASALFSWASDEEVTKFLRFSTHQDISESKRVISRWIASEEKGSFFHWAIVEKQSDTVFGSIGIDLINTHDRRGEAGYCLSKPFWNKGYATEALIAVLRFGFQRAQFHRIEAAYSVLNPASGRVMQKAYMTQEAGPLRDYYYASLLGFQNAILYAAWADTYPME